VVPDTGLAVRRGRGTHRRRPNAHLRQRGRLFTEIGAVRGSESR